MRRRELMPLLGGALTAGRAVRAQQKAMPMIGFLNPTMPSAAGPNMGSLPQWESKTGYFEGQNVAIEYRWAEGRVDWLPALVATHIWCPATNAIVESRLFAARAAAIRCLARSIPSFARLPPRGSRRSTPHPALTNETRGGGAPRYCGRAYPIALSISMVRRTAGRAIIRS
jgi:hypothetical protein